MTLAGWSRVDGYAGLEPAKRLDYRSPAALRIAGARWISSVALANAPSVAAHVAPVPSDGVRTQFASLGEPLPRARFVAQAAVSGDPVHDIAKIELQTTALVEESVDLTASSGLAKAEITSDLPGDIALRVATPTRRLLVIAESFHPGWRATADGKSIPVLRVNGDFLGCVIEPNVTNVRLVFQPLSLWLGKLASGIGVSLLMIGCAWATLRRPRTIKA